MVVDLLDAGGTVLATQDTGELSNSAEWQALALAVMPPAGTRQARLTLVAQRYNGDNNDGYLDSLVLWPRVTNQQLGGSLAGVVPQAIECRNKTRGTQVGVAVRNNWRCKAGGLVLTAGDTVTQRVSSLASSAFMPLGMEVYGMKVKSVTCDNLTTGQRVTIRMFCDAVSKQTELDYIISDQTVAQAPFPEGSFTNRPLATMMDLINKNSVPVEWTVCKSTLIIIPAQNDAK